MPYREARIIDDLERDLLKDRKSSPSVVTRINIDLNHYRQA